MNELLELALDAHGGLDRWRQLSSIRANVAVGGKLLADAQSEGVFDRITIHLDPRIPRASIASFTSRRQIRLFGPERVAMQTTGELGYLLSTWLWTALTTPFLLAQPDLGLEELEPWLEDRETWRRLKATFRARIASQKRDQIFYFGPEGLLRRHDYTMESVGELALAEYTDDHQRFGGISFPTLRRAIGREPDGTSVPEPALLTADIADVKVDTTIHA